MSSKELCVHVYRPIQVWRMCVILNVQKYHRCIRGYIGEMEYR